MTTPKGPVLIELEGAAEHTPATAPVVPDAAPEGRAMRTIAALAARRPSRLWRFLWWATTALAGFLASVAAWRFVAGLLAANPVLGWVAVALFAAFLLALAAVTLRELAAYGRLARLDGVHKAALAALASGDARAARQVTDRLITLYGDRPETEWGRVRLAERRDETFAFWLRSGRGGTAGSPRSWAAVGWNASCSPRPRPIIFTTASMAA